MPILTFQITLLPKLQSLAKRNTIGHYLHCLDHRAGIVGLVKLLLNIPSVMKIFIVRNTKQELGRECCCLYTSVISILALFKSAFLTILNVKVKVSCILEVCQAATFAMQIKLRANAPKDFCQVGDIF